MKICTKCRVNERKPGQRVCKACHAEYMRDYRADKAAANDDEAKALRAECVAMAIAAGASGDGVILRAMQIEAYINGVSAGRPELRVIDNGARPHTETA